MPRQRPLLDGFLGSGLGTRGRALGPVSLQDSALGRKQHGTSQSPMILTYLEFYSGVGGWGYALEAACRSLSASLIHDDAVASKRPRVAVSPPEPEGPGGVTVQRAVEMSLEQDAVQARLLAAFDHSDLCNGVFQHNHRNHGKQQGVKDKDVGKRCKPRQTPIERLTLDELEQYDAAVWCMSPPVCDLLTSDCIVEVAPPHLTFFHGSASRILAR